MSTKLLEKLKWGDLVHLTRNNQLYEITNITNDDRLKVYVQHITTGARDYIADDAEILPIAWRRMELWHNGSWRLTVLDPSQS